MFGTTSKDGIASSTPTAFTFRAPVTMTTSHRPPTPITPSHQSSPAIDTSIQNHLENISTSGKALAEAFHSQQKHLDALTAENNLLKAKNSDLQRFEVQNKHLQGALGEMKIEKEKWMMRAIECEELLVQEPGVAKNLIEDGMVLARIVDKVKTALEAM